MKKNDPRAWIPQVESLLILPEFTVFIQRLSRPVVSRTIAQTLDTLRKEFVTGEVSEDLDESAVRALAIEECRKTLVKKSRQGLQKVLNGTGVVLHTNLGRSPIPTALWDAVREVNTGYSNLEFNLENGERGGRGGLVMELLAVLCGAEAALAVNNNAAAMLLVLEAFCKGKEVIVSRGEAVQIGGGFRIPDILALSGARLKEVGTTNITTTQDYCTAIGPETAAVLLVHSSNFALRGFTEKPSLSALSKALPEDVLRIVDQGSGSTIEGLDSEPSVGSLLRSGADLVCFSGDKILGGPQAGIIIGRADLIAILSKHPLIRAFRPGKTILSLLEASLLARLGGAGVSTIEKGKSDARTRCLAAQRALELSAEPGLKTLRALSKKITSSLPKDRIKIIPSRATLGGGSTPDQTISSMALLIKPQQSAEKLSAALRQASPPLVARIEEEQIVVDLMALTDENPKTVAESIAFAMKIENAGLTVKGKTANTSEGDLGKPL